VAFCFDTAMDQSASQQAQTTQTATALGDQAATAQNVGQTIQRVWQVQQGCQVECHNASATQSLSQNQSTNQSATATAGAGYPAYTGSSREGFLTWLNGFAANIGATIQNIFQYQEASCLNNCVGDTQAQAAGQRAVTAQSAVAGKPPPTVAEPPGNPAPGSSEAPVSSLEPSAAEEPPAAAAAGAGATPATIALGAARARPRADRSSQSGQGTAGWRRSGETAHAGGSPASPVGAGGQAQRPSPGPPGTEADVSATVRPLQSDAAPQTSTRARRSMNAPSADASPTISFGETLMGEPANDSGYWPGFAVLALGMLVLAGLASFLHFGRRRIRPGI
jgi:hypothetical protein